MRVLVTAGTVYGRLDDNKLVGNRVRGIWAAKFAGWLAEQGHEVTLLVADIQKTALADVVFGPMPHDASVGAIVSRARATEHLTFVVQNGFDSYKEKCFELAPQVDAAVMAAAVVNWIPKFPFKGKMPTIGVGEEQLIPFYLAPRVIDGMKERNPELTLISCKMTIGESREHLVELGYKTLLGSRSNAVIANDQKDLLVKLVVHQDRVVLPFHVRGPEFYQHLLGIIKDDHFRTEFRSAELHENPCSEEVRRKFDAIVDKYRSRFVRRVSDGDFVFGSLALPYQDSPDSWAMLVSPREKGSLFTAADATTVAAIRNGWDGPSPLNEILVTGTRKATLNAPLLFRHLGKYHHEDGSGIHGVIHLHEQLPDVPTVSYAPPGTVRDNLRDIPGPVYNIEGHGCIAGLDADGEIVK